MKNDEEKPKEEEPKPLVWKVPQCCVEGWDTCPHVPKKDKKLKTNIGL